MTKVRLRCMPVFKTLFAFSFAIASHFCAAQSNLAPQFADRVRVQAPVIAIEHVRVIDGTGANPKSDQTILISDGKIAAVADSGSVKIPENAQRLDFTGHTALPGLVGMHDHLFYVSNFSHTDDLLAHDMPFSYPRLYLANGVTTIRTAASFEPYEIWKSRGRSTPEL